MVFLGWDRPLLHAAADWLLDPANVPAAPDLSGVLVVVRGNRAGRRLLELLALRCRDRGLILVPPAIVTPAAAVARLARPSADSLAAASSLASALAWGQALGKATKAEQEKLYRHPGETEPGLRARLGMGTHFSRIWSELGGAGVTFRQVIETLEQRFPNVAEFEIPRWEMLEKLHRRAAEILRHLGLEDHTDALVRRAKAGEVSRAFRVVLVGVVDMPLVVRHFFLCLTESPAALVFAPESARDGFVEPGVLRAEFWNKRPAPLEPGQLHLVERDRDQALRVVGLVDAWRGAGIDPGQMTVAVPDAEALPRVREALDGHGVKNRSATGRLALEAPVFHLLRCVADYLDHEPDEPPLFEAVAALVRHPDIAGLETKDWPALDRFCTKHFPARFDPRLVSPPNEAVQRLQDVLESWVDLPAGELTPAQAAEWTLGFLLRVYGDREEMAQSPEGRMIVRGLELWQEVLTETVQGKLPWPAQVRAADFLSAIASTLSEQAVPEPAVAQAVEIVGWLELLEDDAPAVIVTSFYEGAVPEAIAGDPFLPGSLRQVLSVGDNEARMARDAYSLAAIAASRAAGRGALALIAPRFDPAENPVRPSRLGLNGLSGAALARRIWHLASRRVPEEMLPLTDGTGFGEAPLLNSRPLERLRVTAFRDYLESPRKFYFVHVRDLSGEDDEAPELGAADVGTLLHEVLSSFGANAALRASADEALIREFTLARFDELARERYGRWVQPAVEMQLAEIRRRLAGFARVQAALSREGWSVRYVEDANERLTFDLAAAEDAGTLLVTGKIDRIDSDAAGLRWRIIDYKTSAKPKDPRSAHFRAKGAEWVDLQLPLYLKLGAKYAREKWGVELTPQNCELVYFQLPEDEGEAELSAPFPSDRVEEGWAKAAEVARDILQGRFQANPMLQPEPDRNDPALLALCGQAGISHIAPGTADDEPGEE
jgi:ATP-dependent helicase/nuclease subunit B